MLSYQKNALLALIAQFKFRLYEDIRDRLTDRDPITDKPTYNRYDMINIIDRNLTSIEKQIKKL